MRLEKFNLLKDFEKEEAVWKDGIFLEHYDEGNDMCDVYQLFNFYVAFCYELHKNEKANISAYTKSDDLPFLIKSSKFI